MRKKVCFLLLPLLCLVRAAAQPAAVRFAETEHDFGSIREERGAVVYEFRFENRGSEPLVVVDASAACGCTTVDYSSRPVLPGERGVVCVQYDPTNRPGVFDRAVGIFFAGYSDPVVLRIRGEVIGRPLTVEERYPFEVVAGLRFDANLADVGFVPQGASAEVEVGCINLSARSLHLRLTPRQSDPALQVEAPECLAPGQEGRIRIRYVLASAAPRYGSLENELDVSVDGGLPRMTLRVRGVGVDADLDAEDISAPRAALSGNIAKFGTVKRSDPPRETRVVLTNTGGRPLHVRAVECRSVRCSLRPGETIAPGASVEVRFTLDPSCQEYGLLVERAMLLTDDPRRPLQEVRVTAVVED